MFETKPLTNELIRELKAILERKNEQPYSFEETARIGRGLVEIYSELADNPLGIGYIKKKGGGSDGQNIEKEITKR